MEIRIQSLKFDADHKLLEFIEKKVSKMEKFDDAISSIDVSLSLLEEPENKQVKLHSVVRGKDLIIEKKAKTFEEALNECVDVMKETLVRNKEKKQSI